MNKSSLSYWVPTGLLIAMTLMGSFYYASNVAEIQAAYATLGFPAWVMVFNGWAKFLGLFALLLAVPRWLKEFAYAGYLYVYLLALIAHVRAADGEHWSVVVALVFWALSFWQFRKRS